MSYLKDEILYGGVNLSQWFEGIQISRDVMPGVNVNTISVPGRDGVILNGHTFNPLTITVTATLSAKLATDVSRVRHALAKALMSDKDNPLKPLVLPDDPSVTYDAMVTGSTNLSRDYGYPRVSIDFYVPSGYGYGELKTYSIPFSATVGGNAETWPVITVNGASSDYVTVTNVTTGEFIKCKGASNIVIDTENESVTSNGDGVMFDLDSDFFSLRPSGHQQITVSGGTATMSWHPRWV